MNFAVSNMALSQAVAQAVGRIGEELFSGPGPKALHHYTSATSVEAIVRSRTLWATCIEDQVDKEEISHASMLVKELASDIASGRSASEFARDVLNRLPYFMEERKQWIFIACFCDDGDSSLHWKRYGSYRLTFSAPWIGVPALHIADSQAECWYQKVVYDEGKHLHAMRSAVASIVNAISENTSGRNEGPWAQVQIDFCARNTAQLLLGIAVGFKRATFEDEKEWRIVCAPRLGSNSSAPSMLDENFSVNIRPVPRRHVVLQIPRVHAPMVAPIQVAPVPFFQIAYAPNPPCRDEILRINNALSENNREDLCLQLGSDRASAQ